MNRSIRCVLSVLWLVSCGGSATQPGTAPANPGASGVSGSPVESGISGTSSGASGTGEGVSSLGGGSSLPNKCPSYGAGEYLDLRAGPTYEGPAIIERSTEDELVMYFTVQASEASAASNDPVHSTLRGLKAMPIFPVGAKVWLSQAYTPISAYSDHRFKFVLRDGKDGALLLGAGLDGVLAVDSPLEPAPVGNLQVSCKEEQRPTTLQGTPCSQTSSITYYSAEVSADTKVTIRNGETKTVNIGGIAYEATVGATLGIQACTNDAYPVGGLYLGLIAHDLQGRIAQLEVGDPPSCGQGNARGAKVFLFNGSMSPYDGPALFVASNTQPHLLLNDASQLHDTPQWLSWQGDESWSLALVPGATYWTTLTASSQEGSLRRAEHAPFLIASIVEHQVPEVPASETWTEPSFDGTSLTAEPRCTYLYQGPERAPLTLYDLTFGTNPPVTIKSGESGTVTLSGASYRAWVDGVGRISATLRPQ
jgi:hypothetical protein